jgi:two-component system, cell cycle sensor histidine kinase and response regulator CckA
VGFRVLLASHSDEALLLIDNYPKPIHLLLTDVNMDPFMNGCELAKCIRLIRPEIKVLYISGIEGNTMVNQEVEAGRAVFLAKPFSHSEFLLKVRSVIIDKHHLS